MNTNSPYATETADAQAVARSGHISALRWAVRGVLLLGVTASLAANMLHAQPSPEARIIAAWPPVALFATIEVISRVPLRRQGLAAVRIAATIIIGLIAAWISYWHMAAVATRYGEGGATPYLLPVSVDGLVIVSSVSLLELSSRIRQPRVLPTPDVLTQTGSPVAADTGPRTDRTADTQVLPPPVPMRKQQARRRITRDETRRQRAADIVQAVVNLRRSDPSLGADAIGAHVGRSTRQIQRIIKSLEQTPGAQ
jgi:hypothetical protein